MRYKIDVGSERPDKQKFLFFPRYCDTCLTAFWLEKVWFYWTGSWWSTRPCPVCNKGHLWLSKQSAQHWDLHRKDFEEEIENYKEQHKEDSNENRT